MAGLEDHARRYLDGFVSRAGDLEENPVLAFENDFAIVQAARHLHQTVSANQPIWVEPGIPVGRRSIG